MMAMPLSMTSAPVMIFLGGILGGKLAPSEKYATLPIAMFVIGSAIGVVPATRIMNHFGRRNGFVFSQSLAITGALIGALAITQSSFFALLGCAALLGASIAFTQQGRFAAIESVNDISHTPKILSFVMLTGVVGGFLGPEIAYLAKDVTSTSFTGSFLALAIVQIMALAIFSLFKNIDIQTEQHNQNQKRSVKELLSSPCIIYAIATGAIGYGVMSFVMTATPNSMHHIYHHDLGATKWVIQSHIAAMFLPSLVTGFILSKWGADKLVLLGLGFYGVCIAVGLSGVAIPHFWFALVLLGIGWNALFLSGTHLLSQSYSSSEKYAAQALNDLAIFGIQALASLSAGWVLYQIGWRWLLVLNIPLILILFSVILWVKRVSK